MAWYYAACIVFNTVCVALKRINIGGIHNMQTRPRLTLTHLYCSLLLQHAAHTAERTTCCVFNRVLIGQQQEDLISVTYIVSALHWHAERLRQLTEMIMSNNVLRADWAFSCVSPSSTGKCLAEFFSHYLLFFFFGLFRTPNSSCIWGSSESKCSLSPSDARPQGIPDEFYTAYGVGGWGGVG